MADWDDDEFEPEVPGAKGAAAVARTDKWEGEDEDDDIKDAWDADSDEEKKDEKDPGEKAVQKKKKKKLADIIAEKEEAKMRELEGKQAEMDDLEYKNTPEGKLAEKIRMQKLEESSAIELAKEMMGITDSTDSSGLNFNPQTQEEFNELRTGLADKLNELQSSPLYLDFAVELISNLCMNLNVASLKRVKAEAEAYHSTKLKEEKAAKAKGAKGKGGKATIKMETDRSMFGRGMDDGFNDMDDFMWLLIILAFTIHTYINI